MTTCKKCGMGYLDGCQVCNCDNTVLGTPVCDREAFDVDCYEEIIPDVNGEFVSIHVARKLETRLLETLEAFKVEHFKRVREDDLVHTLNRCPTCDRIKELETI